MRSSMFLTKVDHCRGGAARHRFGYTTLSALINLEEWEKMGDVIRFAPLGTISVRAKDYLPGNGCSVRARLVAYLADAGVQGEWARIELLTSPRFLGYVFNPVNFYLCYERGDERPALCVAEVNNTFGETHLYITRSISPHSKGRVQRFTAEKQFHVSPFYDRSGIYEFLVKRSRNMINIRVNLSKNGKLVFTSGIRGATSPSLSRTAATLSAARHTWFTLPRILFHAAVLHFKKKLPVFTKPVPSSEWTIASRPSLLQRTAAAVIFRYFRVLRRGALHMTLPNRETRVFGDTSTESPAAIRVHDWRLFPQLLCRGDIGFGEAFADGSWTSEDPTRVLRFFAENMDVFDDRRVLWTKALRVVNAFAHRFRANSKEGSKNNIPAHYDLGNDLFQRFLDERLVYSCAVYNESTDTLEQAQLNKLRTMISKAKITSEHHVLEIGSGWGAFAVEAVKQTGCRVTTITLSAEQHRAAVERARTEGVADRIEVLLCDYRDVPGKYDRIVSIEMLEAVGHERLGLFFERIDALLKPDGVLAIQFITVPDHKYDDYRRGCDWIQKYIFPGGHCPSVSAVCSAAAKRSAFVVETLENIGPSYARTLKEWRERFRTRSTELSALGYDERFQRMWEYYLSYCEAGFASRYLGTVQVVMTRPFNRELPQCPGYE